MNEGLVDKSEEKPVNESVNKGTTAEQIRNAVRQWELIMQDPERLHVLIEASKELAERRSLNEALVWLKQLMESVATLTPATKLAELCAQLEADRKAALATVAQLQQLLEANATTYHAMRRAHEADLEVLTATRRELQHWQTARQFALEAGEVLKSERDEALNKVEQLRAELAARTEAPK